MVLVQKWKLNLENMLTFIFMVLIVTALTVHSADDNFSFNEVYKDFKDSGRMSGIYIKKLRPINTMVCKYHIKVIPVRYCARTNTCQILHIRKRFRTCTM